MIWNFFRFSCVVSDMLSNISQYNYSKLYVQYNYSKLFVRNIMSNYNESQLQSQSKTGNCQCGNTLTIPQTQCTVQCSKCSECTLFLCHVIANTKDMMCIRCQTCKRLYSLITCPKCQGTAVFENLQSGFTYTCPCDFMTTVLTCNKCFCLICLPTRKNYENTLVNCKKCSNKIKFFLCEECKEPTYLKQNQSEKDMDKCFNSKCSRSRQRPKVEQNPYLESAKMINNRISTFETNAKEAENSKLNQKTPNQSGVSYPKIQTKRDEENCTVCMSREANMINLSCFHVAVCDNCVSKIKGVCPLCRNTGEYKKIFRA